MKKSFTLLEVILAIFVLGVAASGAYTLIYRVLNFSSLLAPKVAASYLAQEGLEIVRNIRDSNWLNDDNWVNGLDNCSNGCEADYLSTALQPYRNRYLKINDNGLYNYSTGSNSHFKRKIIIETISNNEIKVTSKVSYSLKGSDFQVSLFEYLYNWYAP